MYDNEGASFCLIDTNDVKVPCWYLHQRFLNDARMLTAQFRETNLRLPNNNEWLAMVSPLLDQPLHAPIVLDISNAGAKLLTNASANVSGSLAQEIYGDEQAGVWVFWGRQDAGTNVAGWEHSQFVGVNTNFNRTTFTATLNNLATNTNYFFRFYAANSQESAWATASSFSTTVLPGSNYGSRIKSVSVDITAPKL